MCVFTKGEPKEKEKKNINDISLGNEKIEKGIEGGVHIDIIICASHL